MALVFMGCKTPNLYQGTTPGEFSQEGYVTALNRQVCQESQLILKKVDTIYTLLANEFVIEGRSKNYDDFIAGLSPRRYACLIEEPEQCCISVACVGPCNPKYYTPGERPLCARKRGCATNYILWVARNWPPICTAAWPDEPHCITAAAAAVAGARSSSYDDDLVHEVCEQAAWSYNISDQTHASEYYAKTCAAVQKAYGALK